jgi:hypothetical protein
MQQAPIPSYQERNNSKETSKTKQRKKTMRKGTKNEEATKHERDREEGKKALKHKKTAVSCVTSPPKRPCAVCARERGVVYPDSAVAPLFPPVPSPVVELLELFKHFTPVGFVAWPRLALVSSLSSRPLDQKLHHGV